MCKREPGQNAVFFNINDFQSNILFFSFFVGKYDFQVSQRCVGKGSFQFWFIFYFLFLFMLMQLLLTVATHILLKTLRNHSSSGRLSSHFHPLFSDL